MSNRAAFKRIFSIILVVCLLVTVLSGCKKGTGDTVLHVPIEYIPTCYDPQIANENELATILNNCLEGLVRINSEGNIERGVAESWSISEDGLTYTFTLRQNAKWRLPKSSAKILGEDFAESFDARITANDFVFAMKRVLNPETGSPSIVALAPISNVYADSDYTLVIKLSEPSESFLTVLASPACMPCNEAFFEATAGRYGLEPALFLSNGPYYLNQFSDETGVSLKKNDSYVGDHKAIASSVKFALQETDGSLYDIKVVPRDKVDSVDTSIYKLEGYKNAVRAFCFNAKHDALSNQNVRLALAASTNIANFSGDAAEGIVPSCCGLTAGASYRANSNKVLGPQYDLSAAANYVVAAEQENLDENKKPVPLKLSATLVCLKSDETEIKTVLQDWQKTMGTRLAITLTTFDTQLELDKCIESGNFDIAYTTISVTEFISTDFLKRFTSGAIGNIINLNSEEYDSLFEAIYTASNREELIQNSIAAEKYLMDQVYIIPTVTDDTKLAKTSAGSEIKARPSGTIYSFYN